MTRLAYDQLGKPIPVLSFRDDGPADETVSIGPAPSQESSAFNAATRVIRLVATENCHIAIGTNPDAGTSNKLLPANVVEYFAVKGGDKVSVIQTTTAGVLYVSQADGSV